MDKPREFWIEDITNDDCDTRGYICQSDPKEWWGDDHPQPIHVIEYRAYEQSQVIINDLREHIRVQGAQLTKANKAKQKVEANLAIAVEAIQAELKRCGGKVPILTEALTRIKGGER